MKAFNKEYQLLALLIFLFGCSANSDSNSQELILDEVIQNYYQAIGGYERLKSIQTKYTSGTYVEPGYGLIINGETISERGDKRIVHGTGKLIGFFYEGYNGQQVWEYYKGDTIPRIMEGEAEKASRRGAEFDESFVDWKEKGHSVELKGIIDLDGSIVYQIDVILEDSWKKTYYLDSKTFLIKAMRKSMPLHAKGDDVNFLVFYDQYREVDGLLFPFVSTERDIDDNFRMISVRVIDEIRLNLSLDSINFNPHIPDTSKVSLIGS